MYENEYKLYVKDIYPQYEENLREGIESSLGMTRQGRSQTDPSQ